MTSATLFLKKYHNQMKQEEPFTNERRNNLFGKRIGVVLNHPNLEYVQQNNLEGVTCVTKTQD